MPRPAPVMTSVALMTVLPLAIDSPRQAGIMTAAPRRRARCRAAAVYQARPALHRDRLAARRLSSRPSPLVGEALCCARRVGTRAAAHARAARGLAGDPLRCPDADRRPDRLGQDACRLPD